MATEWDQGLASVAGLMGSAAVVLGVCVIVCALSYREWPPSATDELAGTAILPLMTYVVAVSVGLLVYGGNASPDAAVGVFCAAVITASATMTYCIVTTGWRNFFHRASIVMVAVPVGCAVEVSMCFFQSGFRLAASRWSEAVQ